MILTGYIAAVRELRNDERNEKLRMTISAEQSRVPAETTAPPTTSADPVIAPVPGIIIPQETPEIIIPQETPKTIYTRWYTANRESIIKWLADEKCDECVGNNICSYIAAHGLVDMLRNLLIVYGSELYKESVIPIGYAAASGNIDVVKILRDFGFPLSRWACAKAASHGHLEMLKWLVAEGRTPDQRACLYAAKNGQLEILEWLHENRCPWDERTTTAAVEGKHPKVLAYLLGHGCPINSNATIAAIRGGLITVQSQ